MTQFIKKYVKDKSGQFAISFAMGGMILLLAVGVAIDFSYMQQTRAELQNAADSAALAASKEKLTMQRVDHGRLQNIAKQVILENSEAAKDMRDLRVLTSIRGEDVEVDVKGSIPAQMLKFPRYKLGATAVASAIEEYMDVYLLLDKSYSMEIADGPVNIARLKQAIVDDLREEERVANFNGVEPPKMPNGARKLDVLPGGCAFACHQRAGYEPEGKTLADVARENGIPLRSHALNKAVRDAIRSFVDSSPRVRVSTIDFALGPVATQGLTRNVSALDRAANISPSAYGPITRTNYDKLFEYVNTLPKGDGTRQRPNSIVILVTDGVYNHFWDEHTSHLSSPLHSTIDQALCKSVKDKGIPLAVVNVIYSPLRGDPGWDDIEPFYDDISPALESCASAHPNTNVKLYYESSHGNTMRAAFARLAQDLKQIYPYVTH